MQRKTIEYFDGSQKLVGELLYHEENKPAPTVIIFAAFEGRGDFAIDYAKNLAELGFNAFIADMYGDAKVVGTLPEASALFAPFMQDRSLTRRRALLAFDTTIQQKQVDKNKVAAIGFCFGGMCALEVARSGADLKAIVSAHGLLAKSDLPTHPVNGKLLILHGYADPMVPSTLLPSFAEEMASVGNNNWTFVFFGDAKHSFTDPRTGTFDPVKEPAIGRVYNKAAAERSYRYAVDFFKELL
jgi:dienelactone hydrolase